MHRHQGDELRIRAQGRREGLRRDDAAGLGLEPGHLKTLAFKPLKAIDDGLVLNGRGNQVASPASPRRSQALDCQVIRLRSPGGEDHFSDIAAQQRGQLTSPELHGFLRIPTIAMRPGGGIGEVAVEREMGRHNLGDPRVHGGRRGVV